MPIDYTTPVGQVRLLTADCDELNQILTDEQIEALLTLEGGSVLKGAAMALETIAVDQALVLKVIRTLDVQTDGTKVSAELRARARDLRTQADDFDDDVADFAVAEFADPVFARRERFWKQHDRGIV